MNEFKSFLKNNPKKSISITIGLMILLLLILTGQLTGFMFTLGTILMAILVISLCVSFYMLPVIIELIRKHSNLSPIILVNSLFGWSIIGWIVALIWSFTDNTK